MTQQQISATTSESRENCIYDYLAGGFALFPCGNHRKKDPKAPVFTGWQSTEYDPLLEPDTLPEMYGVPLGDDDCVLDVDPRRFKEGENQLTELRKKLTSLKQLNTFVVSTGGGGAHIYFKKPKDVAVLPRVPGFPAIEVKSKGSFVIGAGSRHDVDACPYEACVVCELHMGRAYTIKSGSATEIAEIPQELLDFISTATYLTGDENGVESDDKGARSRFIRYCMTCAPAVKGDGGDKQTFKVACQGKDFGLPEEVVLQIMNDYFNPRSPPGWAWEKLQAKVHNAFEYGKGAPGRDHPKADFADVQIEESLKEEEKLKIKWDLHKSGAEVGGFKPTLTNAVNFFKLPQLRTGENPIFGLLRYNMFSDQIEFTKPAPWHHPDERRAVWEDADAVQLKQWLNDQQNLVINTQTSHEAALVAGRFEQYHPVRDWFKTLRWDGVPRLDKLLVTYAGAADTPYVRHVGAKTLIAAVARILKPGIQHDHMLVLEGDQGTGKSTFVRVLGGAWYAEIIIDPHNKDTVHGMQGAWFIEASEMEFLRRSDMSALKAFLTKLSDKVRLAYHRTPSNLPRQCAFIGTINPRKAGANYLSDPTGNRRFWPVVTTRIDIPALTRDRDQLFAEALARYRKGEPHYLTDQDVINMAKEEQLARVDEDIWIEIIHNWLGNAGEIIPHILTTDLIAYAALNIQPGKIGKLEKARIHEAMKMVGYYSTNVWDKANKRQIRAWVKNPSPDDE